ncbi:MAG TPA: hypothetical protein VIN06_00945, partial [Devosia sp.]
MSVNAALLFETAILMLAAFLAGAVIGLAARYVLARPKPIAAAQPGSTAASTAAPAVPALVTAPEIAPVARPTAAERLAAAAEGKSAATSAMGEVKMPSISLPDAPAIGSIAPSHTAGETVSGRHIDNPEHPQPASLEEVRAELEAQIGAAGSTGETTAEAPAPKAETEDTAIVPAEIAKKEPGPDEPEAAFEAEAETPMLAAISADGGQPVEARVEPELADAPLALLDPPAALA